MTFNKTCLFACALVTIGCMVFSSCQKELGNGQPDTAVSKDAVYTLNGSSTACLDAIIEGQYLAGKSTDSTCIIKLQAAVTKTGRYRITTTNANGYFFSAADSFTNTGLQIVKLYAKGTPLKQGTDFLTVNGAGSNCELQITVKDSLDYQDYFPLTINSTWSYDDLLHPGDTITRTVIDSLPLGNTYYKRVKENFKDGSSRVYFFRKNGNEYTEYVSVDKYTSATTFKVPVSSPIPFFKENIRSNETWRSPEYKGIDSATGKPILLIYLFNCVDDNANIYINGFTHQHVFNITMQAYTRPDELSNYTSAREINGYFFAKGIGMVYMKKTNKFYDKMEIKIRSWNVK